MISPYLSPIFPSNVQLKYIYLACTVTLEIASYEHFWAVAAEGIVLQTKPNIEQKVQNGTRGINVKDVLRFLLALTRTSHIGQ